MIGVGPCFNVKYACFFPIHNDYHQNFAKQATYRRDTKKHFCVSVNCFQNATSSLSHEQLCLKKGYLSLKDVSPIVSLVRPNHGRSIPRNKALETHLFLTNKHALLQER